MLRALASKLKPQLDRIRTYLALSGRGAVIVPWFI